MPPECLDEPLEYDTKVDIFSFGHLTIYLANQKAPEVDRSVTLANKLNEIDKRREALDQVKGGPDNVLHFIAVPCLSDTPDQRPTSRELVRRMEKLCKEQPLPYKKHSTSRGTCIACISVSFMLGKMCCVPWYCCCYYI